MDKRFFIFILLITCYFILKLDLLQFHKVHRYFVALDDLTGCYILGGQRK